MPKPKRGDRSTPPLEKIIIKELPPPVKAPVKPKAAPVKPKAAPVPAAEPEPPHYY